MNVVKFAELCSYVTSLRNQGDDLSTYQIECLEKLVIDLNGTAPKVNLYPMFDAIVAGKKIEAIKAYRELTGEGLLESKNAIERLPMKVLTIKSE